MNLNGIGKSGVEAELRTLAGEIGVSPFKIVVDDVSILASVDVVPGDTTSRKATYMPYSYGNVAAALGEVSVWMRRIARGA